MSDEEPELRAGPPWVMEEMIAAEPELVDEIAASDGAARLAERLQEAARAGEPVIVCGCGTSEHAARALAAITGEALPDLSVAARDAFEAQLDPPRNGLLIGVSHDGSTAATLAAVRHAAARGARTALITARPERCPEGTEAIATPLRDRSWCHTIAYLSPILVCALATGTPASQARTLIERELITHGHRRADAVTLALCQRLLIVGSGVDEVSAAELALKLEEAAHIPCTPLGVEKVLHGHLPAADQRTGLVALRFDPTQAAIRNARTANVAAATSVLEMPAAELVTGGLRSRAQALIAAALALQLLTLELAMLRGTNPDLIRREEPLYRRVAEVGGAG